LKERNSEGKQHRLFDILLNILGLANCFGFNSSDWTDYSVISSG